MGVEVAEAHPAAQTSEAATQWEGAPCQPGADGRVALCTYTRKEQYLSISKPQDLLKATHADSCWNRTKCSAAMPGGGPAALVEVSISLLHTAAVVPGKNVTTRPTDRQQAVRVFVRISSC